MHSHQAVAGAYRRVIFDAVSHYREPESAFMRHLAPGVAEALEARYGIGGMGPQVTGHPRFLGFGSSPDATRNAWQLAQVTTEGPLDPRPGPVPMSHWSRDERLAVMDDQCVERAWFFPTLATTWEERLAGDPVAAVQLFSAFNRWLEDDWGFAYRDRIFAAPYLSLADPAQAVEMLQWCVDHDARVVMIRPGTTQTADGVASPTDPRYDKLWHLAQESGITVAVHAGEAGYLRHGYATTDLPTGVPSAEQLIWSYLHQERPIFDFLAAVLVDRLFERFPGLRLASVESGTHFLPNLITKVKRVRDNHPSHFRLDPLELLRRHVWVVPHWDDNIDEAIDLMGAGQVLFGSGWPLPGGPSSPADYVGEVAHLPSVDQSAILHGNADLLNQRMPLGVRGSA